MEIDETPKVKTALSQDSSISYRSVDSIVNSFCMIYALLLWDGKFNIILNTFQS